MMDTVQRNLHLALLAFLSLALQTSGLPKKALDPSKILLVNLPQEELDRQLDLALQYLDKRLHALYEDHLERHQSKVEHLYELAGKVGLRKRRERAISSFSSTENRDMMKSEVIKIGELELICADEMSSDSYIIQVNWDKYPWMIVDKEGSEIQSTRITGPGGMHEFRRLNPWKEDYKRCKCLHQNLESNCICCRTGDCVCPYCNRCTGCGDVACANSTHEGENYLLQHEEAIDVPVDFVRAVVFQETKSMDNMVGSHIVVAEKNNKIYGFRFMGNDLIMPAFWPSTIKPVTQLALVEIYDGGKRTLLFTFNHNYDTHSYYELQMDSTGTYYLGWGGGIEEWSWVSRGDKMHAISAGTSAFLIVVQKNVLKFHKMQVDSTGDFSTYFMRKTYLQSNSTVLDLVSFQSGGHFHLLVSQTKQVSLYKLLHKEQIFVFFQTLPLHDNMTSFERIFPVKGPKYSDEVVLVAGQENNVVFYTTNGTNTFKPANHQILKHDQTDSLQWDKAMAYIQNDTIVLCVMTKSSLLLHWTGPVYMDKASYPVSEDLVSLVEDLEEKWQSQEKILSDFEDVYAESLVNNSQVDGFVHMRGPVIVKDIKIERVILSSDETVSEILGNQDNKTILHTWSQYLAAVDFIEGNLTTIACKLGEVNDTLQAAVPAIGSDQLIYGRKNFTGAVVEINNFNVKNLYLNKFTPHGAQMLNRIIWQNQSESIAGVKTLTNVRRIYELQVITLDSVKVEKIPTIHADVRLSRVRSRGTIHISGDLEVQDGGTIANLVLRQEVIYLKDGGHYHFGHCTFSDGVQAVNATLAGWVNDYNFTDLMQNSLKTYGDAVFHGSLSLLQPINVSRVEASSVMGVSIEEFMSNVVFTEGKGASVDGTIEFLSPVEVKYDLTCTNLFNERGERLYPQEFLQFSSEMSLGSKNLIHLETTSLEVNGLLNKFDKSAYITVSTDFIGHIILARGADFASIKTEVLIDGVNLTDIKLWLDSSSKKYDIIFLEPVSVSKDVTVSGKINDGDLEKLTKNLIYKYDPYAVLTGSKTFTDCDVSNAAGNGTINDIGIYSFVNLGSPETVSIGTKTFKHGASFHTVQVRGLVDGVNVTDAFNNIVYLDKQDQVVYGKTLKQTLTTNSLSVSGRLAGLELKRLFSTKGTQIFKENQFWTNCVFDNVTATAFTFRDGSTLNAVDFSEINEMRVSLSNPVNITRMTIDGQLEVLSKFQVNKINGVDVPNADYFVRTGVKNQVIKGHIEFENLFVNYINTQEKQGANHINISDINASAVNVTQENLILKGLKFKQVRFLKQVELLDGMISDVNVSSTMLDAVVHNSSTVQTITGHKVFQAGLGSLGDLMNNKVNGRELRKTLLRNHSDQVITGKYTAINVTVNQDIELYAHFNLYNITNIFSEMFSSRKTLKGTFTFDKVEVGVLHLLGTLNGTEVDAVLEDAVRLDHNHSTVSFTGTKVLENVIFSKLNAQRINGTEVDPFLKSLLRTNKPEEVEASFVITGTVYADQIWSQHVLTPVIYGVDMEFWKDIVYCSRNHSIKDIKAFTDISVQTAIRLGTYEGIKLSTDVLNTNKFQNISSMVFKDIHADEVEAQYLNSFDLLSEVDNTLLVTGNQTFKVPVKLDGQLQVMNDISVLGNINGRKWDFKMDLVPLDANSRVLGALEFKQPVISSWLNSSTYTINNINVLELKEKTWYKDIDTTIGANYTLRSVVMKEIVNSSPPEPLGLHTENLADSHTHVVQMYQNEYAFKCGALKFLQDELQNQLYEPDALHDVYKHDFKANVASSATFTVGNSVYIVTSWQNSCISNVYIWNDTLQELVLLDQVKTGWVQLWHHLQKHQVLVPEVVDGAGCEDSVRVWWYGGPFKNGTATLQGLDTSQLWPTLHTSVLKLKGGREYAVGDVIFKVSHSSVIVLDKALNTLASLDFGAFVKSNLAFESGNLPHFAAVVTRAEIGGVKHDLKVLRYYPFSSLLTEVLTMTLPGNTNIDMFSDGHGGAAIHYILLAPENGFSRIYICRGVSRPQLWTELSVFNTDWLQVFRSNKTYIIFGTGHHGLITEVKMRGGHFTPIDLQCDFQEEETSRTISTNITGSPLRTEPREAMTIGSLHSATNGLPEPSSTGRPGPSTTGSQGPSTTGLQGPSTTGSPGAVTTGSPVSVTTGPTGSVTTNSPRPTTAESSEFIADDFLDFDAPIFPIFPPSGYSGFSSAESPGSSSIGSTGSLSDSLGSFSSGSPGLASTRPSGLATTGSPGLATTGSPGSATTGSPGSASTGSPRSSTGSRRSTTTGTPVTMTAGTPSSIMEETSAKKTDPSLSKTTGPPASSATRTDGDSVPVIFDIDLPELDLPFIGI